MIGAWRVSRHTIILGLLCVIVAAQVVVLAQSYGVPWLLKTWRYRDLPARARSALLGEGFYLRSDRGVMEFLDFLQTQVPEDSLLVLPPRRIGGKYTHRDYMQYFMFPRRIDVCSNEWTFDQCYRLMIGEDGYLLSLPQFPPPEQALLRMDYIEWDGQFGVYIPRKGGDG